MFHWPRFVVLGPAALTRQYCEPTALVERAPLVESDETICCPPVVSWGMFFACWDSKVTTTPCVEVGFEFSYSGLISAGRLLTLIAFD